MARRMLINALHPEECRVAVAQDDQLLELEVERADLIQLKGNVYKAPITRIEPSLQAAFLDIGANRNGFLQINDINASYFFDREEQEEENSAPRKRPNIQDVLRAGQELVVQVVKDERAAKGATLTTNLSIPGRFLVLMVGNQRGGVSRKIVDEGQRKRLRQAVQNLEIPAGMGVIVRTAGINKSATELQRDLDALLQTWIDLVQKSLQPSDGPQLLYEESNLAVRTIRDYLSGEIDEILIDEEQTYKNAVSFVEKMVPGFEDRVKFFDKPQPLFTSFHLDAQIDETNNPEVTLPSGGSIVINSTEAVVAIDVNSGRATGQSDVEETAFATNKEAAYTIAKQLRLRDLGGLVVIDFIDMIDRKHKQIVEKALKDAVRYDKAKVEIGRISKFGLLEMSRQRLKYSLVSQHQTTCAHCSGRGRVKTSESAALEVLRKIQSSVFAGGVREIRVHMAPGAALLLLNNKRKMLSDFEDQSGTRILIFADGRKKPDEYDLELMTGKHAEPQRISSGSGQTSPRRRETSERDRDRAGRGSQRRGQSRRRSRGPRGDGRDDSGGRSRRRRSSRSRGSRDRRDRSEDSGEKSSSEAAATAKVNAESKPSGDSGKKDEKSAPKNTERPAGAFVE